MELRTSKLWVVALLAVAVMALAPGGAVADELEPGQLKAITEGTNEAQVIDSGELKARMESFAYEMPETTVLDPGEFKRMTEAPARFAVVEQGELKARMESGTRPLTEGGGTTQAASGGVNWTGLGVASAVLLFAIGAAVLYGRWHRDHIAPA